MRDVHAYLGNWMESLGMEVRVDAIGNLRGVYRRSNHERRLIIGSHLDTVPNAGAFDGVLGVMLGIAVVEELAGERLPFAIEVVGFSEEEGVRFGIPFLGSRAFVSTIDEKLLCARDKQGKSVADAIRDFGLNPGSIGDALLARDAFAYLEFHIEQGPVLDHANEPLGVVQAVIGQSRYIATFFGVANHAGTTPMHLRHDALTGAAEWISSVETKAKQTDGLVATVASIRSEPEAGNVVPGFVSATLDVRHTLGEVRRRAVVDILRSAEHIAAGRGLQFRAELRLDQTTVPMDRSLVDRLQRAAVETGYNARLMTSGAGHDAMIVAGKLPSAMLFVRSPGGTSHHPDENVLPEDVEVALATGVQFVRRFTSE
jgi:allantoate deiminase